MIVSGVKVMFFQIFSGNNSATGADFGNNPGRGEFWRIRRIGAWDIAEIAIFGLPEDATERFFEKSSEKRERFQKFWKYTRCGRFLQKSGTDFRFFGNIPDKAGEVSDFLHMYYTLDAAMSQYADKKADFLQRH